jgi:hypothetical protein
MTGFDRLRTCGAPQSKRSVHAPELNEFFSRVLQELMNFYMPCLLASSLSRFFASVDAQASRALEV